AGSSTSGCEVYLWSATSPDARTDSAGKYSGSRDHIRRRTIRPVTDLRALVDLPRVWDRMDRLERRLFEVTISENAYLTEVSQHLLAAGGKRYRPLVAVLAAEFGPNQDDRPIEAGVAVELIHLGS